MKHLIAPLVISLIQFGCASAPTVDPPQAVAPETNTVASDITGLFIYRDPSATSDVTMDEIEQRFFESFGYRF